MDKMTRRAFGAAGLSLFFAASMSVAQQQPPAQTFRVRAQIEKVDGSLLTLKDRAGAEQKLKLADNARATAMIKASLADLKPNTYIGITALPQADGSQKAIAIHIFQDNQRGVGEGHRPWDLLPNSTMTNAAIDTTVAGVEGQVLTVKYKQGDKVDEKKIIVTPQTAIVRYVPGEISELKAGVHIIVGAATKAADGTYQTAALNFGRDGIIPPM
jgi:hypothetical protein